MTDATLAKPILPDPGDRFMLVMRHADVELALLLTKEQFESDDALSHLTTALRDTVKFCLKPARPQGN